MTSPGVGHRHDWENIVLWFDGESQGHECLDIAVSAHGGYSRYKTGDNGMS